MLNNLQSMVLAEHCMQGCSTVWALCFQPSKANTTSSISGDFYTSAPCHNLGYEENPGPLLPSHIPSP